MVKQNTIHRKHTIRLPVILSNPIAIQFGHTIRTARIERCSLLLRYLLHQSKQLRSRCLINARFLLHAQYPHRFQQAQSAYPIGLCSILGHIKTHLHMTLCRQIVYLIGLYSLNYPDQRTRVGHIAIMQIYSTLFFHIAHPLLQVQMLYAPSIKRRRTT